MTVPSEEWELRLAALWEQLEDEGREREAVSIALGALAPRLPRYQRSLANYARLLVGAEPGPG
jgi:hypothetical protein